MAEEFIEVELLNKKEIINETLTRIGIGNKDKKILYPSVYLFERNGKFYLAHFKQLFGLIKDDAYDNLTDSDVRRRNAIIYLLKTWGLIDVDESKIEPHDIKIFVLSHRDKKDWRIYHKFNWDLVI